MVLTEFQLKSELQKSEETEESGADYFFCALHYNPILVLSYEIFATNLGLLSPTIQIICYIYH